MSGRKDYEERKEIKREIYEKRIQKAEQNSKNEYDKQQKISSAIPMGQPILVDHYSAGRHRRDLEKMDNAMRKSVEEGEKADYYRNKLENIDNDNVISSDDPKAKEKIQAKIDMLEKQKEKIKKREHAPYELQNINAEIRRLKDRKRQLEELDELNFQDIEFEGGKAILNRDVNRLQILFDGKPSENTRNILKHYGFKWARSQGAWQRLYNKNGIYAVKHSLTEILQNELEKMKQEIDNYTDEQLLNNYKILTGLEQEEMSKEEIRQYLKFYWKEQICKDENIILK